MKRLTINNNGMIWVAKLKQVNGHGYVDDYALMKKLAAYEDLGYEPEELKEKFNKIDEIIKICNEVLSGETFLEDSVITEIRNISMKVKGLKPCGE